VTTLGVLYPGFAAEDDYQTGAALLEPPPSVVVVHTRVDEDTNTVEDARRTGEVARLIDGVHDLRARCAALHLRFDVVLWACTAGSFVFGLGGARDQARQLASAAGVPAVSTSLAFLEACYALGLRRVAVGATYPVDEAELFTEFLEQAGIEVLSLDSAGIDAGAGGADLTADEVVAFALGADDAPADAILLPDTALRTMRILERLEAAAGKPVLTANQVTIWAGLQRAGALRPQAGLGALFRAGGPLGGSPGAAS
jgi:maleate cis-trans isomerase